MYDSKFIIKGVDGVDSMVYVWEPSEVRGVLQIVHGSVEHIMRYDGFATYLKENGFIVYGHDIRGHGTSVNSESDLAYFSDNNNGFDLAISEIMEIKNVINEKHSGLKHFVLGHSMGTMLVRKILTQTTNYYDGVLLSGTGGGQKLLLNIAIMLSQVSMNKNGRRYRDERLHNLLYGTLSKKVKDSTTTVDFISSDPQVIKEYLEDEYCGVTVTTEYMYEMLKGIKYVNSKEAFVKTDKDTPIILLSGELDPVGGKKANEVRRIFNKLQKETSNVELKIYPNTRHEILNETNKMEVYNDCITFMSKYM